MVDALDRALAIVPNDLDTKISRAQAELDWKADTRPLHNTIDAFLAPQPTRVWEPISRTTGFISRFPNAISPPRNAR